MPIDVVLRSVPLHLTDAQLCALLGVETVTRFRRTSGPSEKQKPLHLVRACCRSESQAEQLLLQGRVSLDGQECAVERPKAASERWNPERGGQARVGMCMAPVTKPNNAPGDSV